MESTNFGQVEWDELEKRIKSTLQKIDSIIIPLMVSPKLISFHYITLYE